MLVSSKRIVRNPYTPVRTQGNINPACVAAKMETNPQIPRIPMSRSCHNQSVAFVSNGPDKYTTDHLQIITAGMMKLAGRYVRSFLLFSFLKFCLSLCLRISPDTTCSSCESTSSISPITNSFWLCPVFLRYFFNL